MQARRTPCVGICSTTYGDLVCRGCKRFAHEIVAWNGYDAEQQSRIWQRLAELRDGAVMARLQVTEPTLLDARARALALPADGLSQPALIYALMKRLPPGLPPASLGLAPACEAATLGDLRAAIDVEFYRRSVACYERSFRTLAQ